MLIVSLILLQVFIFTGLVFFLRRILNRNVTSATTHLNQLATEYTKKEDQIKEQLEETDRQCKESILSARRDAQQQRKGILAQTQEERDKILNDAQQKGEEIVKQADRTRQALMAEINQKIEEEGLRRAAELVQQALPEHIREEIHHRWLEELTSSSFEQLDRLHVPEGVLETKVVSAFALTSKQREDLKARIKKKLGRQIDLKEEVDASVIAGLIVNIGSLVLDGSLRFKIKQVASAQQQQVSSKQAGSK